MYDKYGRINQVICDYNSLSITEETIMELQQRQNQKEQNT